MNHWDDGQPISANRRSAVRSIASAGLFAAPASHDVTECVGCAVVLIAARRSPLAGCCHHCYARCSAPSSLSAVTPSPFWGQGDVSPLPLDHHGARIRRQPLASFPDAPAALGAYQPAPGGGVDLGVRSSRVLDMLDHEPVGVVGLAGLDQAAFDALLVAASLPPVGNTGVERTRPVAPAAAALVDTVTVVFKSLPLETVLRFFATGRDGELEWLATERGRYGYRSGFARQNVHVWHDGTADMGVCVEITGQGCRQLEAEGVVDNSDLLFPGWVGFLGQCRDMGGKFSRLDVAADDYDGLLNLPRMKELAGRDALVTRFKGGLYCENLDFCTGGSSRPTGGATLYAGSQRSEMYVRCYNKAAEQGEKFQGEHWTRLELQTRKDKADLLAGLLIERGTEAFAGVINNLLSFREPSETDTNHRRWPVCEWWCTFVATLERLPLSVAPEQKTLVGAADWVERQIAPYLSMLLEAPDLGVNWLRGVHARALGRWSRRHREMFGAHIAECERIGRLEPPAPLPVPWGYDVRVSFANL